MKNLTLKLLLGICAALCAPSVPAAVKYWDGNGTTAGAGTAPAGTWSTSAFWSTAADGTATPAVWVSGDSAVFSAGTDATDAYTVTLVGNATAGSITVEEGTVVLGGSGAVVLGGGSITINSGAVLSTSSSVRVSATAGSVMTINGGTAESTNPGAAGSFVDVDQVIVLNGGGVLSHTVSNILNIVQTTTSISGTGPLTKSGAGVLAIAGDCSYSGATFITNGELRIRGSANRLPTGTDVTVTYPGILNLNSVAASGAVGQQIGSLAGNGAVGLGQCVLVIGGSADTAFSGLILNTTNYGAAGSTATVGNGVTKQGTGTITLSGPNAFTGLLTLSAGGINVTPAGSLCSSVCDLQVNGGTLSLTNAAQGVENLFGTGGTIILNSGHTLTINPVNASRGTAFSGAIVGAGGVTKIGAPTESLLGANTYTGPTTLSAGKLVSSTASTGAGSFTVADSTTLGAQVATAGTSLNMSDLTLGASTAEFDFNSQGGPTAAIVHVAGPITLNGTVLVNVKGFNTTTAGPVTLLDYTGLRTDGGTFAFVQGVFPPRAGVVFLDDTANRKVTLNVTSTDSLIWVGNPAGVWNVNTAANTIWKLTSDSSATYYQETAVQGDSVRFDDTKLDTATVSIPATVSPFRVTVENSATNYTFTGAGKISGFGALTKSGSAQLTIATANDYSGGTTLNAGTVNVGNNSAFGAGKLTINGGVIRSDSATARTLSMPVALNVNVTFGDPVNTGDLTFQTGTWTITGASRDINVDTINAAINSVIGQDVAGRGLTKNGNGTLSLGTANTFSGGVTLNAGTLRVNNNNAILANSPVILADGVTLATTAGTGRTITGNFTVNGNFTIGQVAGGTAALTLAGSINLGGTTRTITIPNATDTISGVISNGSILKVGTGTLVLGNPANTYSGTTTVNAGTLAVDADGRIGDGTGTVILNGGNLGASADRNSEIVANPLSILADAAITTTSTAAAADIRFSSSSITVSPGRILTLRNDGADAATDVFEVHFSGGGLAYAEAIVIDNGAVGKTRLNFFNTNTDPAQTFSGVISGDGSINRSASVVGTGGTTILSGDNTYTGGTTVGRGTLLVNNTTGSGTGTGTVTVNSGGVLGGMGTVGGAVVVNSGGIIGAGASAGLLTLTSGLDLSNGGTNVWELAVNSTNNPGGDWDQISLTGGNLVLGGTSRLLVKFIGGATFPDSTNTFWRTNHSWLIIAGSGSAANPGSTSFATVDGVAGNNAGGFTTAADANGNVFLTFTLGVQAPPPVIDPNIVGAGTTSAQLSWSSVADATYKVQYKTNLNQVGWLDLTNLTATGTTTTIVDNTTPVPAERYYRVISP